MYRVIWLAGTDLHGVVRLSLTGLDGVIRLSDIIWVCLPSMDVSGKMFDTEYMFEWSSEVSSYR